MQVRGHGAKLPHKQENAIVALIASETVEKAAQHIGVAPSTLYRWLSDKEFKKSYREAKAVCVSQAIGRLQQISFEAVETLRQLMLNKETPSASRVAAARTILDSAIKAVELESLEARVENLEAYAERQKKHA